MRNNWLKFLPIEISDVEEVKEPTLAIQDGEIEHGEVPLELRKLWSLYKATSRQLEFLKVEQKFEAKDSRKGEIAELSFKSTAMNIIFWIQINDELMLWATGGQMDVREGWKIVTLKPQSGFPFSFLTGDQS